MELDNMTTDTFSNIYEVIRNDRKKTYNQQTDPGSIRTIVKRPKPDLVDNR